MTESLWVDNVLAWLAQGTIVVAAGALVARLMRLQEGRAALACWRTLLAVCVLLPLAQPWRPPVARRTADASGEPLRLVGIASDAAPVTARPAAWPIDQILLLTLIGGIVVRAAWLAGGAASLRRLRRSAAPLAPVPDWLGAVERRVGARAELRVSDRITGPITFGFVRPIVVFPPSVLSLERRIQEAIACHELLHVRRRDWIEEIVEEAIRTALWFHPAARWVIGRMQLSREQAVDREVVALTQSPERYVDALLAVALMNTRAGLMPAPLFLRRRFLKTRIVSLLQESTMSRSRLVVSLAAGAAALAIAAVVSARQFPLQARGPSQQQDTGAPVQIVAGGEGLLHVRLPEYPRAAVERRVEGDVVVQFAVDDKGVVTDARVLAGPEELKAATLRAVLDWHYSPATLRSTVAQATLRFQIPASGLIEKRHHEVEEAQKHELSPAHLIERQMAELERALQDPNLTPQQKDELKMKYAAAKVQLEEGRTAEYKGEVYETRLRNGGNVMSMKIAAAPRFDGTQVLTQIRSERLSDDARAAAANAAGVRIGDRITEADAKRIREAIKQVDEHLRVEFGSDGKGGIVLVIVAP